MHRSRNLSNGVFLKESYTLSIDKLYSYTEKYSAGVTVGLKPLAA